MEYFQKSISAYVAYHLLPAGRTVCHFCSFKSFSMFNKYASPWTLLNGEMDYMLLQVSIAIILSIAVQALATEYLKRKTIEKSNISSPISKEAQCMASSLFRNGIKKRNVRQLLESQRTRVPEIFKFTASWNDHVDDAMLLINEWANSL